MQGIQGFIFQTNKLKEIAGASELVEQICTDQFEPLVGDFKKENAIVTAAGNIKYVFDDEQQCRDFVRIFPKKVMEFAPGVTISQAVVKISGNEINKGDIEELEKRLKAQRNKLFRPFDIGLMAVNRSRRTGLPAKKEEEEDGELTAIDYGTHAKVGDYRERRKRIIESFFGTIDSKRIPWNIESITGTKGRSYGWLAVIHVDGNNMGLKMQEMSDEIEHSGTGQYGEKFREFSLRLDEATKKAAQHAYRETTKTEKSDVEPCRPIVIGGDDLTIVIRADLALEFTKNFLANFENETKDRLSRLGVKALQKGLTACAGIAYVKENYPFHYGYQLAETLCGEAKKRAKENLGDGELTPSCLMFHKVQDSFVEDYNDIRERELHAGAIWFDVGPYYLEHKLKPTISRLQQCVAQLLDKEGNAVKSHLRQWLTDLYNPNGLADQKMDRFISHGSTNQITKKKIRELGLPGVARKNGKSPVYDWLSICSIAEGSITKGGE